MTAREDQTQAIVHYRALLGFDRVGLLVQAHELSEALSPIGHRAVAAQPIDCPPPGGHGDPRPGIGRDPVPPPSRHCIDEGILHGILGQLEVTDMTDQRRQYGSALLAERARDRDSWVVVVRWAADHSTPGGSDGRGIRALSRTGRTSTEP